MLLGAGLAVPFLSLSVLQQSDSAGAGDKSNLWRISCHGPGRRTYWGRQDKRSRPHPRRKHLSFNAQLKPQWVAKLDTQQESGLERLQGSLLKWSSNAAGLGNLRNDGQLENSLGVSFHMVQQGKVPSVTMSRSALTWTALISRYIQAGQGKEALKTYHMMRESGLELPRYALPSLLKVCGSLSDHEEGRRLHGEALRKGWESDLFVGTALVAMYAKCRSIVEAKDVFDGLAQRDVVSWNAILAAFASDCQADEVLCLYEQMLEDDICPDRQTYITVLQACSLLAEKEQSSTSLAWAWIKPRSTVRCRILHFEAQRKGYGSDTFIGSILVSVYSKSGSIVDAQNSFDSLSERHVVAWNAMLLAYVQQGQAEKTLLLYERMVEECIDPDDRTFVSALHACSILAEKEENLVNGMLMKVKSLNVGKTIHAEASKRGYNSNAFVGSTLISLYSKCGSIMDAEEAVSDVYECDVVAWNSILAAYAQNGQGEKSLHVYSQLREEGLKPNVRTFVSALQACGLLAEKEDFTVFDGLSKKIRSAGMAKALHAEAFLKGHKSDVFLGNTLISTYGKCGCLEEAWSVFDELAHRDVASWNAMLAAYVLQGQGRMALELYEQMSQEGVSPDDRSFVAVLQACTINAEVEQEVLLKGQATKVECLETGKIVHAEARSRGYELDPFVASSLVTMYGKCGSIVDAQYVFDGLSQRNLVSWNAMLAAYASLRQPKKAVEMYEQLLCEGVCPDDWTFVSLLQACGMLAETEDGDDEHLTKLRSLKKGRVIHAETWMRAYGSDVFVGSALVSMYGKCGSIADAQQVFDELSYRDLVSWNVVLAAYAVQGQEEKALVLYEQMLLEGLSPDAHTFVSALQACSALAGKEQDGLVDGQPIKVMCLATTKVVHADVCKRGYQSDVFVGSTLIGLYDRCGSVADAEKVFDGLSKRDVLAWNLMLAAYAHQGQGERTWELYRDMQEDGVTPNDISVVIVLQACSHSGRLDACIQVHHDLLSTGNTLSPLLANTLIYVYGRCANMVAAQEVFDTLHQPDEVSWNTLIAGYARQGNWKASLRCYEEMQQAGVQPNGVTFLSLLSACSHAGLVDKGVDYFESMTREHGLSPGIEHYASMVDLLGRAGCFTGIEDMLSSMPVQPNLPIWLSLLGACRKHGKVELGKIAFHSAMRVQPEHSAPYVLMSNIYSHAGLWDSAKEVTELRHKAGAWKRPGQSWIGLGQETHTFVVGDLNHQDRGRLHELIAELRLELDKVGQCV